MTTRAAHETPAPRDAVRRVIATTAAQWWPRAVPTPPHPPDLVATPAQPQPQPLPPKVAQAGR